MTLEEYFAEHPEEEQGFYDDMAELANYDEILDIPEDWVMAHANS